MKEPYTLSGMSNGDDLDPTMIGCPACAGVLALVQDDSANCRLICSVGHRFSVESLLEAKEEELEKTMWSSIALLAHVDMVIQKLLQQPGGTDQNRREALKKRIDQARLHARQLRDMIEEIRRPNLSYPIH